MKVVILLACFSIFTATIGLPLVRMSTYKQLKCYQCKSNSSAEIISLCDNSFWKLTTKAEKLSMEFSCPRAHSRYCTKKVSCKGDMVLTHRSCQGPVDKRGTHLKEGCMHMTQQNYTLCLCGNDLCNGADLNTRSSVYTMFGLCLFALFNA
jgi:hypothetical protein